MSKLAKIIILCIYITQVWTSKIFKLSKVVKMYKEHKYKKIILVFIII